MSSWEPWNQWFEWGEAKEVEGGPGARRTGARRAPTVETYDPKRQARLARALAAIDRQPRPDREDVLRAAVEVLAAPDQVRRQLGLRRES